MEKNLLEFLKMIKKINSSKKSKTVISTKISLGLVLLMTLAGCSDDVGKVSLGLFTTKDVVINAKQDPVVKGVTCHISHIEADLDFSDPSDMSIACRQTGEISAEDLAKIDRSKKW